MSNTIAIFDFDGTLTKSDTFNAFLIYSTNKFTFWTYVLTHFYLFIGYFLEFLENKTVKDRIASSLLKGISKDKFEKLAVEFSKNELPRLTRQVALESLLKHQKAGDKVVIISASLIEWIKPWAKKHGVDDVIASKMEVDGNNILTGKLSYNCFGLEKRKAFVSKFSNWERNEIHVYTDSKSDNSLLKIATHKHYRKF